MSTETADQVRKTTSYTLTRGALYLIEGLLQTPTPFNTTVLTHRASKLWSRLRRENKPKAMIEGVEVNLEKNFTRDGRSEEEFAKYRLARDEAYLAWQDEQTTIDLTKKEEAVVTTGIAWAIKNRDKVWPVNNQHIAAILDAFQLTEDE